MERERCGEYLEEFGGTKLESKGCFVEGTDNILIRDNTVVKITLGEARE